MSVPGGFSLPGAGSRTPAFCRALNTNVQLRSSSSCRQGRGGQSPRSSLGQNPGCCGTAPGPSRGATQEPSPPSPGLGPPGLLPPQLGWLRCPRGWGLAKPPLPPQHRRPGGAWCPQRCSGMGGSARREVAVGLCPFLSPQRPRSGTHRIPQHPPRPAAPTNSAFCLAWDSCPSFSRFLRSFCFWKQGITQGIIVP